MGWIFCRLWKDLDGSFFACFYHFKFCSHSPIDLNTNVIHVKLFHLTKLFEFCKNPKLFSCILKASKGHLFLSIHCCYLNCKCSRVTHTYQHETHSKLNALWKAVRWGRGPKVASPPPPEYFSNRVPGCIVNREAKPSQIHGIESAKSATFMDLVCSYRIFMSAFPTNSGQAYWPAVSRSAICYTTLPVKIVSKWGIGPFGHENG